MNRILALLLLVLACFGAQAAIDCYPQTAGGTGGDVGTVYISRTGALALAWTCPGGTWSWTAIRWTGPTMTWRDATSMRRTIDMMAARGEAAAVLPELQAGLPTPHN